MSSKLFQAIYSLLDIDHRGGTLIQKDDNVIIAYDIPQIDASDVLAISNSLGGVAIHIKSSNVSSGGFVVIIEQKFIACVWKSAEFVFLVQCLILLVISYAYAQVTPTHFK